MARRGFSLLELIMVMVIVVLLVQFAAIYLAPSQIASNEAVTEKVLSNMSVASEQYAIDNGQYPANPTELAAAMDGQQFCFDPTAGYQITCFFYVGTGYLYQAMPVSPGKTGNKLFIIETGSNWISN